MINHGKIYENIGGIINTSHAPNTQTNINIKTNFGVSQTTKNLDKNSKIVITSVQTPTNYNQRV